MLQNNELVFLFGGEGGGIEIRRECEKFIYHHNEFDATGEGGDIDKKFEFDTFAEPFQMINSRYRWYSMFFMVHEDFQEFVAVELVKRLNQNGVNPTDFRFSQSYFDHSLGVTIKFESEPIPMWSVVLNA